MSEAPEIDEDEAGRLLERHLRRADVGPLELVGEGEWSRCFGFVLDGRDLVVRFGRRRDDFEKDERAARAAPPGMRVPEVLSLDRRPPRLAALRAPVPSSRDPLDRRPAGHR